MAGILLIGQGGREHALGWRLRAEGLISAPGNPGLAELGECVAIPADRTDALVTEARKRKVDLVIPGPEQPLAQGIADKMAAAGITCLGPNRKAARLEASKAFARGFCAENHIPSPWYAVCSDRREVADALKRCPGRGVAVKADGLYGGKGVVLCPEKAEGAAAAQPFLDEGGTVVLEELLEGEELSFFALVAGGRAIALGAARDYKRLNTSVSAPNTGGMGVISAPQLPDSKLEREIMEKAVMPVAKGLDYCGVLFAGLMLTAHGIKVLEYNVRFGDPECQALMMRLEGDLAKALKATAEGRPPQDELGLGKKAAACIVMANDGYPGKPKSRGVIKNIDKVENRDDLMVFHAGSKRGENGEIIAEGGRVLGVAASSSKTLDEALKTAYQAVEILKWQGAIYRKDIGG